MFKIFKIIPLVMVGVGIATFAHAQKSGAAKAASIDMPEIGAYEALSRGNKKVAEALFNGQIVTANGKEPLSLDLIAASKQRNGWGRIFRQLKADGLLDAKNLGDLVSGRHQRQIDARSKRANRSTDATVVTTAAGRQIIIDKKAHGRQSRRNTGRRHANGVLGTGSTYRGRQNSSVQTRSGASLGITSGNGVGTSNIVTGEPK